MIDDSAVISRRDTALSSRIEDKVLMMDIDSGAYYELDTTGARIWDLLEQPMAFLAICGALAEAYDVDSATCRSDTAAFVNELRELGLVDVS